ncbi:hypothetical protein [Subdoligranulum variabile]
MCDGGFFGSGVSGWKAVTGKGVAMDIALLKVLLRFMGTIVLMVAGGGSGVAACAKKKEERQEIYMLSRLFAYMEQLLSYQALTGEELLQHAKIYPQFLRLGIQSCTRLERLPLPETLSLPLCEEIQADLRKLSLAPRETACKTLQHMAALCREAAQQKEKEVQVAEKLWPRLGLCLGALTAILLW